MPNWGHTDGVCEGLRGCPICKTLANQRAAKHRAALLEFQKFLTALDIPAKNIGKLIAYVDKHFHCRN